MNYGFILNNGNFEYITKDTLKEALIAIGAYSGIIPSKIVHAFLVDRDFKASDCLEYINNHCFSLEDRIEKIIKFEDINLDKLD